MARSIKARSGKILRGKERKVSKRTTVGWTIVHHPEFTHQVAYLLIVRDKKGLQSPMYLLTSVGIDSAKEAWEMVHSYMYRWGIEQAFRAGKAKLEMESPRLWFCRAAVAGKPAEVVGDGRFGA